jgi:hypothetical protein
MAHLNQLVVKEKTMRTELVKITPSMAEHYLSKNVLNRNVSQRLVDKYAHDMENNNWELNHQGIAFYEDGSVADGQHRLLAIIKSRKTIQIMVTTGLKKPSAVTIDIGRKRSMSDGIQIGGLSDWINKRHISMIGQIADPKRLSPQETVDWLEGMESSAKFSLEVFPSNRRALVNGVLHAAMALAHFYNPEKESQLRKFAEVYMDGLVTNKKELSAIKLRDEFMTNTRNGGSYRKDKFLKAQRAIQAFLDEEVMNRLVRPKTDIWTYNLEETA